MKKLKGGFTPLLNKEKTKLFSYDRDTVWEYIIPGYELARAYKTLPDVSVLALSHDETMLAVKNTSGKIMLLKNGEVIGSCKMEKVEGYTMSFMPGDRHILDFDGDGRCMLLDTQTLTHCVKLALPAKGFADIYYDEQTAMITAPVSGSKLVYRVSPDDWQPHSIRADMPCNFGMYWETAYSPNDQLVYNIRKHDLNVLDNNFSALSKHSVKTVNMKGMFLADSEKLLFIIDGNTGRLYDFPSMSLHQEFSHEYMSGAVFVENESKIVISTWEGLFVEDIAEVKR